MLPHDIQYTYVYCCAYDCTCVYTVQGMANGCKFTNDRGIRNGVLRRIVPWERNARDCKFEWREQHPRHISNCKQETETQIWQRHGTQDIWGRVLREWSAFVAAIVAFIFALMEHVGHPFGFKQHDTEIVKLVLGHARHTWRAEWTRFHIWWFQSHDARHSWRAVRITSSSSSSFFLSSSTTAAQ